MSCCLYPDDQSFLSRGEREKSKTFSGGVVWFYGLSGSGKSTLAGGLETRLLKEGELPVILDGDRVRSGLCSDLNFSDESRKENIRRVAEVSKILSQQGFLVLVSLITPLKTFRAMARDIIGEENFLEIFVSASFEICAKRDVKGLYRKAEEKKLSVFSGKDSPFELPEGANICVVETSKSEIFECVDSILIRVNQKFAIEK